MHPITRLPPEPRFLLASSDIIELEIGSRSLGREMATQSSALGEILQQLTVEGELYEKLPDKAVRCYACGHRCLIKPGREGVTLGGVKFPRGS